MYALCLFSGIRIEEIAKVRWEWIVWGEGEIRLPGFYVCEDQKTVRITKNGQPRNIPISKALKAWIPKRGEGGLVVYPKNLRKRREAVAEAAGVAGKRNALRHSFASYHAAKHRDPGLLQMILGHETSSVMFRHYITAVKGADAKRFFALRPEKLIAEAC
jgi:integrase/recombinase XerD